MASQRAASPAAAAPNWVLTWSDEFNGAVGGSVDGSKWLIEQGGGGFGNAEHEYYTNRTENISIQSDGQASDGRALAIVARKENIGLNCWYGACQYTSGRLNTSGRFSQAYGRVEARLRLPIGKGIWPAFWMLGGGNWPTDGEIDIMEYLGHDAGRVYGTIHGPGYSGAGGIGGNYVLPGGARFNDAYHLFAVEWEPNVIRWYVDGTQYFQVTPASLPAGTQWVYDHPFFIILNLAVGGQWPGYPDASTVFPQTYWVDYVRVYKAGPTNPDGSPWNNTPAAIPGTVQAENFNTGGEGTAYHDTDAANNGTQYRAGEGVDIGLSNDTDAGYSVGWAGATEWLKYTVNVSSAGTYRLNARLASLNTGGTFHVEVDGANVSGAIAVPDTGGWSNWTTISKDGINLPAGQHVLRVVLDQNGASGAVANFNWFSFDKTTVNYPIPGKVEAESFSAMSGIQLEATTDTGGGQNVGYIDTGDWLDYPVNVAAAGAYTVQYRVASTGATGQIQLRNGAGTTLATTAVPNTGGWQTWTAAQATVNLAAGAQTLRVYAGGGGFNLNWLNFAQAATCGSANAALGRPATASTSENAQYPASAAVDGNAATRWSSAWSDPQWLQIDLGSTKSVCRVRLSWEAAYGSAYQIQVSNDAATWTTIRTVSGENGGSDDLTGLSGSGRYVRIYATARATTYGYSLWEAEVFTQ